MKALIYSAVIYSELHTRTTYVKRITFPRLQRLRERASMLRYTCIACFVSCYAMEEQAGVKFNTRPYC